MYKIYLIAALLLPVLAQASCPEYRRIFGTVNVQKKSWSTLNVSKNPVPICGELPLPAEKNLEVILTKGENRFSTKIFQTLLGYDEGQGKDSFEGKRFPLKELSLDTFVPDWYQGAKMQIIEISTNKTIVETKL